MATLADVARRAAVSKGTVSRVLNNKMHMPISQPTIERIRKAADELGYRPHAPARALATGKTQIIGLYYGNMADPHFTRMLQAVEGKARELGYHLVVSSDLEGLQGEGLMDGILVVGVPNEPRFSPLRETRPTMFVSPLQDRTLPSNFVAWNDGDGVYQAVQRLLEMGHRRIAGVFGDYAEEEPPLPRVVGFRKAIAEGAGTAFEYYGSLSADQIETGSLLTRRMLKEERGVTAIFARNDYIALGALQALHERGIAVPKQMSVVGFSDSVLARGAYPKLTSVRTPFAEAGVLALEQLIRMIETGEKTDFPGILLPITWTDRDSCAPPPTEQKRTATALQPDPSQAELEVVTT